MQAMKPKTEFMKVEFVSERPLASMVVTAYNHEHYIREAVESAFSQTYSPLEILLSDDCSTDGTYNVMCELASNYHGPHRVRLNRNPSNFGVINHVNRSFELINGFARIGCAGDDIAHPDKVMASVEILLDDRITQAVCFKQDFIDASGRPFYSSEYTDSTLTFTAGQRLDALKNMIAFKGGWVQGSAAAYRKTLYQKYGPLPPESHAEDYLLSLAAWLEGQCVFDPRPMVRYRIHTESLTQKMAIGSDFAQFIRTEKARIAGRQACLEFAENAILNIENCLPENEKVLLAHDISDSFKALELTNIWLGKPPWRTFPCALLKRFMLNKDDFSAWQYSIAKYFIKQQILKIVHHFKSHD
jgi:GT2 family glycosyltransferase